ncbi:MAG: Lyzozyme M1 (1,4-beta-N-acetylmuramidase) [Ruminococcaceae bacterium]|nr:Lyzozyme M1 (1,4-beta-N-acetylmuramidase) [Oscillospiraceae bacterium]
MRKKIGILLPVFLLLSLLLCGCRGIFTPRPVETIDPYAGLVPVESGYGTQIWVKDYETLDVNPFLGKSDLHAVSDAYEIRRGVDVSMHQGEIDWTAVAGCGVDFAIIRAGYRAYGETGALFTDPYFEANVQAARENGIDVGVYFFSQALDAAEAVEEADYLLQLLEPYRGDITLPVFYDWEEITHDTARTDGMGGEAVTDCAVAFCERVKAAGHTPGVYAYRYLAYYNYDLERIADYTWWIGALGEVPDFYYAHEFWQCRIRPEIDGIQGDVDIDIWFCPVAEPETEPAEQPAQTKEA